MLFLSLHQNCITISLNLAGNEHVSVFKDEAINWHVIWKMSGSPPKRYVFEMRKASRAKYHKQIKFIHNHREEIRDKKC